ncbi:MAG: substrate-binding domain-containing protein [Ruminococcus sp.]|nr:substrate-binding domain-containing protein [Ruminococcus sp.]
MSAGQAVADDECVAVKKSSSFLSDKSLGNIKICGSTSMASLIEKMAEDYRSYNPNVVIEITATDSSDGLNSAIRGECNIAMSSRELADYENELLTKKSGGKGRYRRYCEFGKSRQQSFKRTDKTDL